METPTDIRAAGDTFRSVKTTLLLLLAFALPQLSRAQLILFEARLSGSQEVPARVTSATGFATASLDLATNFFVFNDTWSGLSAPSTGKHIHSPAPAGANAGVIIPFTAADGFILGTTFGSVSYSTFLTPARASELLNGLFYVNVHTTAFPGGEIRGQLHAVPEPSTYALVGVALLGCVVWRRSRVSSASRNT